MEKEPTIFEEVVNKRLDKISQSLDEHKNDNLCDFKEVKFTNKLQQEAIDKITLILEGSEELGIDGVRPMLKEIVENWRGMSWLSKNIFKLLVGAGVGVGAIVAIVEFFRRFK